MAGNPALPLILEMGSEQFYACWVASEESALSPAPRWGAGDSGVQYVLMRKDQAIPEKSFEWKRIDPSTLRDTHAGLVELEIGQELNGASLSFGENAWTFIVQQTPKIGELLSRNIGLAEVRYSDRYLRSPLVLLLLHSLIKGLSEFSGGMSVNTRLLVQTTLLERFGTEQSRRIYHNWRDGEDRRDVVNSWFGKEFANFQWDDENANTELPHERKLELIWVDGSYCKIILDQGVGYWRIVHGIRSEFPFDSEVMQQVNWLNKSNVLIEAISKTHATHWYCGYNR